jgi:hypothetical protein
MTIAKILAVLVAGPLIGALLGFTVGGILLPHDPTGRGSPGDGFLLFMCTIWGLIVASVISVVISIYIIRKRAQHT